MSGLHKESSLTKVPAQQEGDAMRVTKLRQIGVFIPDKELLFQPIKSHQGAHFAYLSVLMPLKAQTEESEIK